MSRALALLALGGAAIAQETKIDVLLPGWNATNIGASIVGVEKSITTIVLECQDPKDFKCGIMYGGTVWQGDKTWSMHSSFNDKTASNSLYAVRIPELLVIMTNSSLQHRGVRVRAGPPQGAGHLHRQLQWGY